MTNANATAHRIAELLSSDDADICNQGLELLITLDDPDVVDALLEGVDFVRHSYEDMTPYGFGRFCSTSRSSHELSSNRLLAIVARGRSPMADQWRTSTTSLGCDYAGPEDLAHLSAFPNLEALCVAYPESLATLSDELSLPKLRDLRINGGNQRKLPRALLHLPALEQLSFRFAELTELDVRGLAKLKVLDLSAMPSLVELDGLEHLTDLERVVAESLTGLSHESIDRLVMTPAAAIVGSRFRARLREQSDDVQGAIEDLSFVIQNEPDEEAFATRARLRSRAEDEIGAAEDYEHAIRASNKPNLVYLHNRATCYSRTGDFERSERCFEEALAAFPGSADTWYCLGCLYGDSDRLHEGIDAYSRAVSLESADIAESQSYHNRGDLAFRLGRFDDALDDASRALALKPADCVATSNRAEAYLALGRPELCLLDANRCLELKCEGTNADELARAAATQLAGTTGHEERAQLVARAVERFGETADGQEKAWAKRFAEALSSASWDDWVDGIRYVKPGVLRHGCAYGVLPLRVHDDASEWVMRVLPDCDRYVLSEAPDGTRAAALRDTVDSLLVGPDIVDISSLWGFSRLEALFIENVNDVRRLASLAKLPRVKSIGFGSCTITDDWLDELLAVSQLTEARFHRCRFATPLSSVAKLSTIRVLYLDEQSYPGPLDGLSGMPSLRELWLSGVDSSNVPSVLQPLVRRCHRPTEKGAG